MPTTKLNGGLKKCHYADSVYQKKHYSLPCAEFDRHNRNLVLTAFGPGKAFEALMGAYAQGDDLSPLGWVCSMDWKLCPLYRLPFHEDPFLPPRSSQ
jgi:hypothetical protein